MTTSGRAGGDGGMDGAMDSGMDDRPTVVISSPEELIASIPAMLGFPPGRGSVVVMCGNTADGRQGPVVRMDVDGLLDGSRASSYGGNPYRAGTYRSGTYRSDLYHRDPYGGDPYDDSDYDDELAWPPELGAELPARGLAQFCSREGVSGVHLVVVHEDCADGSGAGLRAEDAAAAFEYWLGMVGTRVIAAYGVGEFAEGARWVDLFGMVGGVQLDPDATEIAAVHAFDGRVRAGSRDEIAQLYLARDPDACDIDPHGRGLAELERPTAVERAVAAHDGAVELLEAGEEIDDDELARIGEALLDIAVRDEVYRRLAQLGLGHEDGRRLLWWALARRRPGRERSVALVLLGAGAYFAGSGVHARSALEAAVSADPRNSLARLLLHGLEQGIAPERLRQAAA
ncbi:DUF4192 domain-containing protein [Rhodococcus sp. IEGM 1408]|uniref:DUF4192 domain-containing protein n=1 Tax=Rhodococcus sp. IEGM 1408 TaxID=3082220 RepID=UPI002953FB2A|nr:DUF4192 domain-containing protein [Rhodococcus sp. IEGM 1408]MDV8002703.1 DUF4192 domain-containing protein [Rhodococcus sp. IEGM 1408]